MTHLLEFFFATGFSATGVLVWFCLLMAGRADREASRVDQLHFAAKSENPSSHPSTIETN